MQQCASQTESDTPVQLCLMTSPELAIDT